MGLKETRARLMADPEAAARIKSYAIENQVVANLAALRRGRATQKEVAEVLGVSQRRVSAIEHSEDLQLSTIRGYLEALGLELDIAARTPEGERIEIAVG